MTVRNSIAFRLPLGAVLLVGFLAVIICPGRGAEELSREQQIADIERQIEELRRKLETLRQVPTPPPSPAPGIPADWIKSLSWRSIGPASMGGRIVALSVYEADPSTYWVATASGGLLKTTNNGVTFEHQFDHENTVSIGDVCVAPSDRNIVWVGTGENNPRNSVSYGDGVYKSVDSGKTWKHMGLKETFQTGKIVIHPKNPDIVYVGALGRLYGPNKERGLYKTTDGGKSWEQVLFVDENTGVIDIRMNPKDPETLLVATWTRRRDEYDSFRGEPAPNGDAYGPVVQFGPGSGIYKTTDGFKTHKKLKTGLPTVEMGRIGLDYYQKDPKTVLAIIDTKQIGMGPPPPSVYLGIQGGNDKDGVKLAVVAENSPAAKAGLKAGDVIVKGDGKELKTYFQLLDLLRRHKASDKVTFDVRRDKETKSFTVTLARRPDEAPGRPMPASSDFRLEDAMGSVRVAEVAPKGLAEQAGLKVGDVIQEIDGKKVKSRRELFEVLSQHNPGDKVKVKVLRGKETKELTLTVGRGSRIGRGGPPDTRRPYSSYLGGQRPNVQDEQGPEGFQYGGVYKSTDDGETWTRINSVNPRPMYFSQVRVDPSDDQHVYVLGIEMYQSHDGGKSFKPEGNKGLHPDQHALWINPKDGRHLVIGCDGGFYVSYDRSASWRYLNSMAIGQFYHVAVDTRRPYRAYGGLQDNGSWGGPTHTLDGQGPINSDWIMVAGGDGFVCQVDHSDPNIVYFESQDGHMGRRDLRNGSSRIIRPRQERGQAPYRFNWNTPFILSRHNPRIFYAGGNYVFRSVERGDDLRIVSEEITRTKRGSATALAESPRSAEVLWAGTDDGNLWVMRDGKWTNVADRVGLPGPRWVASIEPSRAVEGRAYVAFDAHRSNDDQPYVYVTEDYGKTWKSLRANLPVGSSRVLREDVFNPNVLYLGTEFAVWVSLDRGGSWTKLNSNLPTVAVHELAQHPATGEIVAATHGRSLWVLDATPLRQMSAQTVKAAAMLYRPATAVRWHREPPRGTPYGAGSSRFAGENPPSGAQVYYSLTKKAKKVQVRIVDFMGKTIREIPAKGDVGLHRLSWDLSGAPVSTGPPTGMDVILPFTSYGLMATLESQLARLRPRGNVATPPGMYRVVLSVDGQDYIQALRLESDPDVDTTNLITEEEKEEDREQESGDRGQESGDRDQ